TGLPLAEALDERFDAGTRHQERCSERVGAHLEKALGLARAADRRPLVAIEENVTVLVRIREAAAQPAVPGRQIVHNHEGANLVIEERQPREVLRKRKLSRPHPLGLEQVHDLRQGGAAELEAAALLGGHPVALAYRV